MHLNTIQGGIPLISKNITKVQLFRAQFRIKSQEKNEAKAPEYIEKLFLEDINIKQIYNNVVQSSKKVADILEQKTNLLEENRNKIVQEDIDEGGLNIDTQDTALRLNTALQEFQESVQIKQQLVQNYDQDVERLESVGAGSAALVGGLIAYLPILISSNPQSLQFLIQLCLTGVQCGLFGIVYRYAVRKDVDNIFLKSGVVGAFGLVRALSQASEYFDYVHYQGELVPVALQVSQKVFTSLIVFAFCSVTVDLAIKKGAINSFNGFQMDKFQINRQKL